MRSEARATRRHPRLNPATSEIARISDVELRLAEDEEPVERPEWQQEILPTAREGKCLRLPDRFEIHEWSIMERFAGDHRDSKVRDEPPHAVRGAGAFRFFRAAIRHLGVEDDRHRFRERIRGDRPGVAGSRRHRIQTGADEVTVGSKVPGLRQLAGGITLTVLFGAITAAQEPVKTTVSGRPFVANLHLPESGGPSPGILVLGGSGGGIGWQDYMADILAREGFAALAVAYFGMEGLPKHLDRIPLEYVEATLEYLGAHPRADAHRIGIVGVSKGGELALLLASRQSAIRAVVAFVPSSVVFQSIADGFPRTSSWSYRGLPLPFVPYAASDPADSSLADLYRRSLEQHEADGSANIRVEEINGPILLLSGKQDTLWPSSHMSEMIIERLRKHRFRFPFEHIAYDNAGHLISQRRSDAAKRGGSDEGNRFAQEDGQRRLLSFLVRHLGNNRRDDGQRTPR